MDDNSKKIKRQAVWLTFIDILNKEQLVQLIKTLEIDFPKEDTNGLVNYVKDVAERFSLDQTSTKPLFSTLFSHLNSSELEQYEDPLLYIQSSSISNTSNKLPRRSKPINIDNKIEQSDIKKATLKTPSKPLTYSLPSHTIDEQPSQNSAPINTSVNSDNIDNKKLDTEVLPKDSPPLPSTAHHESTEKKENNKNLDPEILVFTHFMESLLARFPLEQTELLAEIATLAKKEKSFSKLDKSQIDKWSKAPVSFRWILISSGETINTLVHLSYTTLCDFLGPVEADYLFHQILHDCKKIPAAKEFNPENLLSQD